MKLDDAARAAVACELHTGIPAELIVAQWAIESGWGKHAPGSNCFGVKTYPGCHGRQLLATTEWFTDAQLAAFLALGDGREATPKGKQTGTRKEYRVRDWFATFPTLAACFDRRATLFLKGRYKPHAERYLKDGDLEALVRGIAPIYATAGNYGDVVLQIARQANVRAAINRYREPS